MSDIFICYSRTDSTIAGKLVERLRAEGWTVFFDVQTPVGRRWDREIEKALHTAKAVVVLWSAQSRDSEFVLEEAEYGKRKDILFPAFIDRVEFPYGFGRIQTADLIGWVGEPDHPGLKQLLESLRLRFNVPEKPPTTVSPKPVQDLPGRLPAPGQTFRDKLKMGGEGSLMVVIPAGQFVMGSPPDEPERRDDEGPRHDVRIAGPFAMGVYAVTFDDYDRFCDSTNRSKPDDRGWGRNNRPVINVTWEDAQAYCAWLSKQTGRSYRLPSEAEWEYACRAGTTTPFHFGERVTTDQANFDGNYTYNGSAEGEYREKTMPVGSFPPNAFGLYDMHGNVWEWCQDAWHGNYNDAPTDGSAWEAEGDVARVVRGGSWLGPPVGARSACRGGLAPGGRGVSVGFRVVCASPLE
jgi:formylglycine-generating enzyme required for sulfatase activity